MMGRDADDELQEHKTSASARERETPTNGEETGRPTPAGGDAAEKKKKGEARRDGEWDVEETMWLRGCERVFG